MKLLVGMMLTAAIIGLAGCGTTEKTWVADQPPPIMKTDPATTTIDPTKLPAANTRVSADEIDETNVRDQYKRLESELNDNQRALSKVGR